MVPPHRIDCNPNIIWHGANKLWSSPTGPAMAAAPATTTSGFDASADHNLSDVPDKPVTKRNLTGVFSGFVAA
jgi:hypothetical protein